MPQFTAGSSHVAENRRKYMDPNYRLKKLRHIEEEDVVRLLAHRAPGEKYKSIHPPLEEMEEPECAVREMVEPTEGAKAGDRIRYVSFTDSMQFAPITPRLRACSAYNRYRGVDIGVSSGSTIIEARERDIEKISKELIDSETFDPARTGLRGRTVYGHAVRLDENGMMFDALRRWSQDPSTKEVTYVKDMIGGAMDKEISLGKPLPDDELLKRTTMYRNAAGGLWQEVDDPEAMDVCAEIHWKRTVGGFQPWKKMEDIPGGKKDVGVKDLKLFGWRGGVEYYKDISPLPEGLMEPLRGHPMPKDEKEKILSEFKELVNKRNLDKGIIKSFEKMLEILIINK
jgi:methyl-coenzyme M reductase gamma subunit